MSISINHSKCIACGKCVEACPGNLIKLTPIAAIKTLAGAPSSAATAAEQELTCTASAEQEADFTAAAAKAGKVAVIKRVRDCWGCTSCIKECPVSAIDFFLGADIGGKGSLMNVTEEKDVYLWKITSPDGSIQEIKINRKDSNKY